MDRRTIREAVGSAAPSLPVALLLVLALVAGAPAEARPELDAETVVEKIQGWLDGTRSLEARFEQTMVSGAMGQGLEETGLMFVERPGRMRWDYLDPEVKVAVVDGDRTRLYIEEDEEMFLGTLDGDAGLLPGLLAGDERLEELFEPGLIATPQSGGGGFYLLRLVPRGGSESFEEVILLTRAPRFAIEGAEVVDPTGNRVRYRFADFRRNRKLPEGLFTFEPPAGTRIEGGR